MGVDSFSPIAPARVKVLVLPVGRIKGKRFQSFVTRLQAVTSVRLGDVAADTRPGRGSLSPTAFPDGRVYLDVTSSALPTANADLAPFELFRNQMIIIGAVDALEYVQDQSRDRRLVEDGSRDVFLARAHDSFVSTLENAQEQFPGVISTHLLVFDLPDAADAERKRSWIPDGTLQVPAPAQSPDGTIMSVMCEVLSTFFGDLSVYADEVKTWTAVATPASLQSHAQRFDSDRRPNFDRRASDHSHGSRSSSPEREAFGRASPRPNSQAFSSPSASVVGSPRPDSPAMRSEWPASTHSGVTAETPTPTTAGGIWKQKAKYASMNGNKTPGGSLFPGGIAPVNPEKERNIGKARVGITLGTIYMMAGHWPDAWKEFHEHVNKAKTLTDYIWLASGIERMLICMLLLGSEGYPFTVPDVCQAGVERQSGLFGDSARRSQTIIGPKDLTATYTSLKKLRALLADVVTTILTYYERAGTFNGEALPQIAFSETMLRLVKLQTFAATKSMAGLSDYAFEGGRLDALRSPAVAVAATDPLRVFLSDLLMKAYPAVFADISASNRVQILAGIAASFGMLGMSRKRAMILRELIVLIVPSLQQARRAGAAELGIHPSSSLSYIPDPFQSSLAEQTPSSVNGLLESLHALYGLQNGVQLSRQQQLEEATSHRRDEDFYEKLIDEVTAAVARTSAVDELGNKWLKIDILRESIDFCESLADHVGVAANVVLLLRIAGPGGPIDPTQARHHVSLASEEQVQMANLLASITEVLSSRPRYWDDFVLRSVQLAGDDSTGRLVEHSRADLANDPKKGPFLHDAWAKKSDKKQENIVVAGEPFMLGVVLQNPYDVEVEIAHIAIEVEDGRIQIEQLHAILGPCRLQEVVCEATIESPGTFKIVGCRLALAGCRNDFFPIYNDEWQVVHRTKVKDASREIAFAGYQDIPSEADKNVPDTFQMSLVAVGSQPKLAYHRTSLKDRSLMLLEGETQSFKVFLENVSSQDINFLRISFDDASRSLSTALAAAEPSRATLYDVEKNLAEHPVFTWQQSGTEYQQSIPAGRAATIEMTIRGRLGLESPLVRIDYAYLAEDSAKHEGRFFTRQMSIDLALTVAPSIEITHLDVALRSPNSDLALGNDKAMSPKLSSPSGPAENNDADHGTFRRAPRKVMLTFDVCNASNSSIVATVSVLDDTTDAHVCERSITPGDSERFVVPLAAIYVARAFARIPLMGPQSRRQFVVSTSGESAEDERRARELFWYREELLKRLNISWREKGRDRQGVFNVRSLLITRRHVEALRLQDLDFDVSITGISEEPSSVQKSAVQQIGSSSYVVKTGEFLRLTARIYNRSLCEVRAVLRIRPTSGNCQEGATEELVSRRFIWSGILQRPLSAIESDATTIEGLNFCIIASGIYEIHIVAEEIMATKSPAKAANSSHDIDDDDDLDEARVMHGVERRVWHLETPITITAR